MVFIKNGYVYHTAQDDLAHVSSGTLQHVGDNLLPTVRAMANSPYLVDSLAFRDRSAVFFDVWGLVLFVFPDADVARIFYFCLGTLVLLLDFRVFSKSVLGEWVADIARALGFQCLVFLGGIMASLLVGVLFAVFSSHSMAWYAHFHLSCLLFGLSTLAGVLGTHLLCINVLPREIKEKRDGSHSQKEPPVFSKFSLGSQADRGALLFHTAIMLLCAVRGIHSAYVFAVPVVLTLLGQLGSSLRAVSRVLPLSSFPICVSVTSAIVVALNCEMYLALSSFFLPITGRLGGVVQTDLLIAALLGFASSFVLILPAASTHRRSNLSTADTISPLLKISSPITAAMVCFLFLQRPFSATSPKRLFLLQTTRKYFGKPAAAGAPPPLTKSDSGLWVIPFDVRGLSPDIENLEIPELMTEGKRSVTCEPESVYCGYPWYFPIQEMIGPTTWYVPMPDGQQPFPPDSPLSLTLLREEHSGGTRKLFFRGVGPTHMSVVIEGPLSRWSLTEDTVPYESSSSCVEAIRKRGGVDGTSTQIDCRWVFFSTGSGNPSLGKGLWDFWLETPSDGSVMRFAFFGHYGLDHETEGSVVASVASQLPDWTALVSWATEWHQYEF